MLGLNKVLASITTIIFFSLIIAIAVIAIIVFGSILIGFIGAVL